MEKIKNCPICKRKPNLWVGEGYNYSKYPETKGKYLLYSLSCRRGIHEIGNNKSYLTKDKAIKNWNKIVDMLMQAKI